MLDKLTPNDADRFWKKVDQSGGPDECWPFTGYVSTNGYGHFGIGGKANHRIVGAHRVAFALTHGATELPCIRHRCHNRKCCNPHHLIAGTHADNMQDMVESGRSLRGDASWSRQNRHRIASGDRNGSRTRPDRLRRGESSPAAKLTEGQVRQIRAIYQAGGESHKSIGRMFGVSASIIRLIVNKQRWKHVE